MSCYIGMGSNLGDSVSALRMAAHHISELDQTQLLRTSSIYQTAPMSSGDQPSYFNAVAEILTELTAARLLKELQRIENEMGRERFPDRWQSRIIDLDILLYGQEIIKTDNLIVPHPGLHERAFVLYPLHELDASLRLPGKESVAELMQEPLLGEIEQRLEDVLWP